MTMATEFLYGAGIGSAYMGYQLLTQPYGGSVAKGAAGMVTTGLLSIYANQLVDVATVFGESTSTSPKTATYAQPSTTESWFSRPSASKATSGPNFLTTSKGMTFTW